MLTALPFACSGLIVSRCSVSFTSRLIAFHAFLPGCVLFLRLLFVYHPLLSPIMLLFHAFLSCNCYFLGGLFNQRLLFI